MRTITVFSTLGKNAQEVESGATIWANLQKDLYSKNISYNGMKAVIGETRLTIESPNASLPEGDFSLYLMPIKTKSGTDRKELFTTIKGIIEKNPAAKSFFIVDGKNMTQLSTPTLEDLVGKYTGNPVPQAPADISKAKTKASRPLTNFESATKIAAEIAELLAEEDTDKAEVEDEINEKVAALVGLVDAPKETEKLIEVVKSVGESAEIKAVREAKEAEAKAIKDAKDKKNQEMAAKADNLMRDFSDVRR